MIISFSGTPGFWFALYLQGDSTSSLLEGLDQGLEEMKLLHSLLRLLLHLRFVRNLADWPRLKHLESPVQKAHPESCLLQAPVPSWIAAKTCNDKNVNSLDCLSIDSRTWHTHRLQYQSSSGLSKKTFTVLCTQIITIPDSRICIISSWSWCIYNNK